MIKVDISTEMKLKSNKALSMYEVNAARHLNRVANQFKNISSVAMHKSSGGRFYKVTKTGKPHQASVKGNPPAKDTGRLINSLFVTPASPTKLSASLSTNVEYAGFLEDKDNLDRPFMSERSQPFQDTKTFAERVAKDISLGVSNI